MWIHYVDKRVKEDKGEGIHYVEKVKKGKGVKGKGGFQTIYEVNKHNQLLGNIQHPFFHKYADFPFNDQSTKSLPSSVPPPLSLSTKWIHKMDPQNGSTKWIHIVE